jgi:hypothetical protein
VLTGGGADIQYGKVVFDYTTPNPASTICGLLTTSNSHGWTNTGDKFQSSTVTAGHALGWSDDGAGHVTVMYTLHGDADLNGTVNGADLNVVLSNYNQTGDYWYQGDFDYNGTVNGADLNIVLSNYNQHLSVGTAVPEPSTLLLAAAGLVGLLAYAWRKRK